MKTYLFKTPTGRFIINDERSKIGYCYPRLFIEVGDEYVNIDFTLGTAFKMKRQQFESWLDGTEIIDADPKKVCKDLGIIYDVMMSVIADIQASC